MDRPPYDCTPDQTLYHQLLCISWVVCWSEHHDTVSMTVVSVTLVTADYPTAGVTVLGYRLGGYQSVLYYFIYLLLSELPTALPVFCIISPSDIPST